MVLWRRAQLSHSYSRNIPIGVTCLLEFKSTRIRLVMHFTISTETTRGTHLANAVFACGDNKMELYLLVAIYDRIDP